MQPQQQQNTGQGGQPMMEPPRQVTVKDCLYITDMLAWNLLAMKKANFFAGRVQNPKVRAALERAGKMHQSHYLKILSHLKTENLGSSPTVM